MEVLGDDPGRSIEGIDNLLAWLQDLIDRTIAELNGTHFDIPEPLARVEGDDRAARAARGDVLHGSVRGLLPARPHVVPDDGQDPLPAVGRGQHCYHEGVPGHHLQVGQVCIPAGRAHAVSSAAGGPMSGHGEGWALYAERLMGELGYLEDPDYELGMLAAQAIRAVRVVVDIGMHLELPIPDERGVPPGRASGRRSSRCRS